MASNEAPYILGEAIALEAWLNIPDHPIEELERLIDLALRIIGDGVQ